MTAIGIDYGTSNSEVVYFDGTAHQHIKLDPLDKKGNKIRSSVFIYFEDELPPPPDAMVEAKVAQLQRVISEQIDKAKDGYYSAKDPKEQAMYSDRIDSLRGDLHNKPALQRKAIAQLMHAMSLDEIPLLRLVEHGKFAFGEEGFRRFLKMPDKGRLIYSPKNFLGASLDGDQKQAFIGIIAKQLAYFKQCAEQQLGKVVNNAVIGRPVKFHGTRGEEGNAQAIQIMTEAATKAGFSGVNFLDEPIAAAYKIEQTLPRDTTTLIVDIGGGTTDICCIKLSPERSNQLDRKEDVLSVTGRRLGGMDCDKSLVLKAIAPEMGMGLKMINGLPVPPTYFSDMCAVDNIPALTRFFSDDYGLDISQTMSVIKEPAQLERLLIVQENKLSARVVNSARLAKELLSSKQNITLPLHYIEDDFDVEISQDSLKKALKPWLDKVKALVVECLENSSEKPEVVMITGGMSLSPIVVDALYENLLTGLPRLENDAFNSVCEGLAIQAAKHA
ncbi:MULTISPECIES: Hsp70 family protein [unclassified Alteromonas]|uniref:Hsp70 family protein n=1 Tax=unclassified Alteromonas TaxID=2614992 RepID=UPI001EF2D619|nr:MULTISPECIES: Hsp70 family protein [unclassified Alteromonas]MCG7641457.1 Hsp70 family protein [Alteromonas sp. MmMcT2-2]MCG7651315.1 Hsp70 family protein [Alteromonas sp. MmMcT2-5]|tara:strand:- start:1346 stop:2848 length:1503 start_codon:yes stop_codon:yes gene_type:complete